VPSGAVESPTDVTLNICVHVVLVEREVRHRRPPEQSGVDGEKSCVAGEKARRSPAVRPWLVRRFEAI
jgi:hypothetical protein